MEWTMFDRWMVLGAMGIGWSVVFIIRWFWMAGKGIYWNDKEQQIMTMGGKCLYDKDSILSGLQNHKESLESVINDIKILRLWRKGCEGNDYEVMELRDKYAKAVNGLDALTRQLQCSAKTEGKHGKWEFRGTLKSHPRLMLPLFVFKCSICDLEITLTKKELSKAEREHLTGLGIIKGGK